MQSAGLGAKAAGRAVGRVGPVPDPVTLSKPLTRAKLTIATSGDRAPTSKISPINCHYKGKI
jgi:hypothetical protein